MSRWNKRCHLGGEILTDKKLQGDTRDVVHNTDFYVVLWIGSTSKNRRSSVFDGSNYSPETGDVDWEIRHLARGVA